jgi:glucose-6-phosphate 1-dehydrogenase
VADSSAATLMRPGFPAPRARPYPLRAGIDSSRIQDLCNVIFFRASGDLMERMLIPALYNLRLEDMLPNDFGIIGFSRSSYTDEQFRAEMKQAIDEFSRSGPAKDRFGAISRNASRHLGRFRRRGVLSQAARAHREQR